MGSDLIAFTELFITGYNTQDLIKKPLFQSSTRSNFKIGKNCKNGPAIAIGGPAILKESFIMPIISWPMVMLLM